MESGLTQGSEIRSASPGKIVDIAMGGLKQRFAADKAAPDLGGHTGKAARQVPAGTRACVDLGAAKRRATIVRRLASCTHLRSSPKSPPTCRCLQTLFQHSLGEARVDCAERDYRAL